MRLILPVPPSANRWTRSTGKNRWYTTHEARKYTANLANIVISQGAKKIASPTQLTVSIQWFRERQSGDVDKRGAIMLDALQGIAYDNDSQIKRYTIERFEDKANPRMEVVIEEVFSGPPIEMGRGA